jgi:ArsR family transcriptional regulator, arsenate/arsenite/antimonite-responsive transcriptional repressor
MAEVFKALGDPTRLEIITLLTESENLCVNVIAQKTGMSQPAISQHLKVLKNSGFLDAKKMGMHVHYSLNKAKVEEFKKSLFSLFAEKPAHNCTECPKGLQTKKKKAV